MALVILRKTVSSQIRLRSYDVLLEKKPWDSKSRPGDFLVLKGKSCAQTELIKATHHTGQKPSSLPENSRTSDVETIYRKRYLDLIKPVKAEREPLSHHSFWNCRYLDIKWLKWKHQSFSQWSWWRSKKPWSSPQCAKYYMVLRTSTELYRNIVSGERVTKWTDFRNEGMDATHNFWIYWSSLLLFDDIMD